MTPRITEKERFSRPEAEAAPSDLDIAQLTRLFGVPALVAINRFSSDSEAEIVLVRQAALEAGAKAAVVSTHFAHGGRGALDLARAVLEAAKEPGEFRFLYPLEASIEKKIETICTQVYGADGVDYSPHARSQIEAYTRLGYDRLPICMAKTPLSLSHDQRSKAFQRDSGYRFGRLGPRLEPAISTLWRRGSRRCLDYPRGRHSSTLTWTMSLAELSVYRETTDLLWLGCRQHQNELVTSFTSYR